MARYADTIARLDFPYLAKAAATNALSGASMAPAPPAPENVEIAGAVTPDARLSWKATAGPPATTFRVYWRDTAEAAWTHSRDAGTAVALTLRRFQMSKSPRPMPPRAAARHGAARVISKLGLGSRSEAATWVREGRVRVNGRVVHDPEFPVRQDLDRIDIDGRTPAPAARMSLMLNKPRGLVTSTRDEKDRATVYSCLTGAALPWLAPVGRLDKASEGLLLFSNDPAWAARITGSASRLLKTYHVQIDRLPDAGLLAGLEQGALVQGEHLAVRSVRTLRGGQKNAWLEIGLEEGRNRHIRRLLEAFDVSVIRLVRVAIGPLTLGALAKGKWRPLTEEEMDWF